MGIYKGNIELGTLAFGSAEMQAIYIGATQVFRRVPQNAPYLVFEFTNSSFTPSKNRVSHGYGDWTRVSSSPNRWKWTCDAFVHSNTHALGWVAVFSSTDSAGNPTLIPSNLGDGTCKIVDAGGDFSSIESTDRLFYGCTGLTEFVHIPLMDGVIVNTSGMFKNCTGLVNDDAAKYYAFLSGNTSTFQPMTGVTPLVNTPSNHADTFIGTTPAANLDYIPIGWGGNVAPAGTAIATALESGKSSWKINAGVLDLIVDAVNNGEDVNLFTTASISSYAGVKMDRSRSHNKINGFSTATSTYMYYRPCFVQMPGIPNSSTTFQPTWILTTPGYNGSLAPNVAAVDMPGILDYSVYGPMSLEYGTYDSTSQAKFAILITNVDPTNWTGLSGGMAFLLNSNYLSDAGIKYFTV